MNAVTSGSRIPCILIAGLILLASAVCPAAASNSGFTGNSQISALGVWEQDVSASLEDGDTLHFLSGSQFLPPCTSDTSKTVQLFAVITTDDGSGPKTVRAVVRNTGSYLESVELSLQSQPEGIFVTGKAGIANLISYSAAVTPDGVIGRLRDGTASVWKGEVEIPPGSNAGEYSVIVTAVDKNDNVSLPVSNSFKYIPVACIDFDFSAINYGDSQIDREKWVEGDDNFGTGDKPSVRNTGNSPARITFVQDDMGFGEDTDSTWNVGYGVRVADNSSVIRYTPKRDTLLSDPIRPGATEPLDFSIQVYEGTGKHTGTMTMGFEIAEIDESSPSEFLPSENLPSEDNKPMPIPEFPAFPDFLESLMGFLNPVTE